MPSEKRRIEEAPLQASAIPAKPQVVSIQSMQAMVKCHDCYLAALRKHTSRRKPGDKKKTRAMRKRLKEPEAVTVLLGVYVHSKYVSDEERRAMAETESACCGRAVPPTRNALKETLLDELDKDDTREAVRQRVSRIVDAAIYFGLVKEHRKRKNNKPLRATDRLHRLMNAAGVPIARLLYNAINVRSISI